MSDPISGGITNLTDKIIAYETDGLDEEETVELFQELVDNGMAWQLQGCYGRTAAQLIAIGAVQMKEPDV